jgi:Right handed beta helix region
MRERLISILVILAAVGCSSVVQAATLQVGPGKQFAKPCAAILAASAGDTIQIDSSVSYVGDVCAWTTNNLTIVGVGGQRAHIDAGGLNSQGKGIWVISGKDTTIENIELSGATVPDQNGAAIRQQADNLTLRNVYFHDNEEGILTDSSPTSTILIEFSEFANNGFGDGQSHNLYIGHIGTLIFRYNYSHHAKIGHLLKSRAAQNFIQYNRLSDEATGTASYRCTERRQILRDRQSDRARATERQQYVYRLFGRRS